MFRLKTWRAVVIALVALPVSGGALPASAHQVLEAADSHLQEDAVGTLPMIVLITAALWVAGVTLVIAVRRRRTQDADDR